MVVICKVIQLHGQNDPFLIVKKNIIIINDEKVSATVFCYLKKSSGSL